MTLAKPFIPNARLHDGQLPATYTKAGRRHQLDVAIGPSDSGLNDAFGRVRVAAPYTLFDSKMTHDNSPLFWDDAQTSGGGTTSTYNANQSSVTLAVSANIAGVRVRQTKRRFNYQPGKSLLIVMTGVLGSKVSGINKRIGYFDSDNGIFFQLNGTVMQLVKRTKTSGAPVDTIVNQADWNIDTMDGDGPSGATLDTTKTQIFFMDIEWLGVGRVRCGLYIDGVPTYVHQFVHANVLDLVYMSTPNLPIRYEIQNSGSGDAASMTQICSTVVSEGGQDNTGYVRSIDMSTTPVAANVIGTQYALLGLRLKSAFLDTTVAMLRHSILCGTANDQFLWRWLLNPMVAGAFTYTDLANSAVQFAIGVAANTVAGGTQLAAGYGHSTEAPSIDDATQLALGSTIAGVADTLVLCVVPVTNTQNVYAACQWRELV